MGGRPWGVGQKLLQSEVYYAGRGANSGEASHCNGTGCISRGGNMPTWQIWAFIFGKGGPTWLSERGGYYKLRASDGGKVGLGGEKPYVYEVDIRSKMNKGRSGRTAQHKRKRTRVILYRLRNRWVRRRGSDRTGRRRRPCAMCRDHAWRRARVSHELSACTHPRDHRDATRTLSLSPVFRIT